jgi:hypothetical protein
LQIRIEGYDWECGDGCCSEWGVHLYVDDEFIADFSSNERAYEYVLEHYFKVEIIY